MQLEDKILNNCGCCEGISQETPIRIYNRPGLPAISYRTGDHTAFKESLLTRLSGKGLPALRKLTTRSDDDFTIALLDAWAVAGDILTFYQERIANESYLETATEQFSILHLARLIGYELRPGVAAGTYLAFTMEKVPGELLLSPAEKSQAVIPPITLSAGTKVQSTPGPGETAQTFETIETIEARPEWNAMQPRLLQPQLNISSQYVIVVDGTANDLKAGDILLVHGSLSAKKILRIETDTVQNTTLLYLDAGAGLPAYTEPSLTVDGNLADYPEKVAFSEKVLSDLLAKNWKQEDLSSLMEIQGWSATELANSLMEATTPKQATGLVSVFRKKTGVFGYNALMQVTYNGSVPKPASDWDEWDLDEENNKVYLDSPNEQVLPDTYIAVQNAGDTIETSAVYKVTRADTRSRTAYGLSAKTTELTIDAPSQWWVGNQSSLAEIRPVTIHAQSVGLPLAFLPIETTVSGDTLTLAQYYPGLKKGSVVILTGERADLKGNIHNEIRGLKEVYVVEGLTVLVFDTPLDYSYIRKTVTINANVAAATHGETVKEILGSGNAAAIFQKFVLKQNPLTHISSTAPSGTASTLEIRVNNLLWYEVPSFFERGPSEHIYITRLDDEGKTTVIFGDGKNGARLPTGQENVRATYRKGIGSAGNVKANQLSQLMTRPLGLKSATNPLPASGAQDGEALEDARANAKLTIYTLGRIVTLQDYEDFARAFAGISKALSTWVWAGQKRSICLTVAGTNGAAVEEESILFENLLNAIADAGIPGVPVTLLSYQPRYFKVKASVLVHADYIADLVLKAVEAALRTQFSFANRLFGQPVSLGEVIAVMQQVEGVVAVDVDELYRSDDAPDLKDRLFALVPRPGSEAVFPAELLTIDSSPIGLSIML
jgi:hypothetical protein